MERKRTESTEAEIRRLKRELAKLPRTAVPANSLTAEELIAMTECETYRLYTDAWRASGDWWDWYDKKQQREEWERGKRRGREPDMVRFATERTGMTLSVSLSAPTEAKLRKRAAAAGKDPADYARALIEREMLADESFDEILRPARESFRKSGATEAQLDRAVSRARKAISRRKVRRGKSK